MNKAIQPAGVSANRDRAGTARAPSGLLLLALVAGLVVLVGLTFAPVLRGDFAVLDDGYNIFLNPRMGVLNADRLAAFFGDLSSARRYMPVGWTGLSLVFTLQGMEPAGYHAASLAWHAVAAVGLFFTAYNYFGACLAPAKINSRRTVAALLVAAAWALHPLRVEAVSWASGMLHSQTCAFAFMATACWTLRWSIPGRAGWLALAAGVALTLSLLTYPLALGAAGICWLLDVSMGAPLPGTALPESRFARWHVTWGVVVLGVLVVSAFATTMISRQAGAEVFAAMPTVTEFGLWERSVQALYMWGHYFVFLFFPFKAAPIYTTLYDLHPAQTGVYIVAGLSLVVPLGVLAWSRHRLTILGWLAAYTIVAVPVLGLTEHPWIPHDRYASLLQPVLLIGGVSLLARHASTLVFRSVTVGFVALIFAGAVYAHVLTDVWSTPEKFTARLQEVLPRNAWAGHYLGKVPTSDLFLKGRFDEIGPVLARAESLAPGWSADPLRADYAVLIKRHREFLASEWPGRNLAPLTIWHFATGKTFEQEKDWPTAVAHFQAAQRLDRDLPEAVQEEAWCELEMNRPVAARATMERAIALPHCPPVNARENSFWRLLAAVHHARAEPALEADTIARAAQRSGASGAK